DMCMFKQTIQTNRGKAEFEGLCVRSPLIIEDFITGRSPKGYRLGDNKEVVEALRAVAENRSWPRGVYSSNNNDDLGRILTGLKKEFENYFYSYFGIKPRLWIVASS
ncbi:hypothetical protein J1N35_044202, partial [Gossypium stocksii]